MMTGLRALVLSGLVCVAPALGRANVPPPTSLAAKQEADRLDKLPPVTPHGRAHVDVSGRTEKGKASFYGRRFVNRKMADGRRMNPAADVAASKTLPLGSVAKITNLDNGKSATVKIEDRGPFVDGRVVDLAPTVAARLDIGRQGAVQVEVKPITVPQPEGGVKLGSGAATASPAEVEQATAATEDLKRTLQR